MEEEVAEEAAGVEEVTEETGGVDEVSPLPSSPFLFPRQVALAIHPLPEGRTHARTPTHRHGQTWHTLRTRP